MKSLETVFAAERLYKTAQGFYEAELVKRALRKRCFLLVGVFWSGYGKKGACKRLIGA